MPENRQMLYTVFNEKAGEKALKRRKTGEEDNAGTDLFEQGLAV